VSYFGDSTLDATYTYQAGNIDPKWPAANRFLHGTTMFDGPMWKIAYDF